MWPNPEFGSACDSLHGPSRKVLNIPIFLVFLSFLGHPWHMEVPSLGVESELHLPAYTTATTMQDLS